MGSTLKEKRTTKQLSGLKTFLEMKRCGAKGGFELPRGNVCSIDEDEAVFVLLSVEVEDRVSSLSIRTAINSRFAAVKENLALTNCQSTLLEVGRVIDHLNVC